jgi:hypothetical protein
MPQQPISSQKAYAAEALVQQPSCAATPAASSPSPAAVRRPWSVPQLTVLPTRLTSVINNPIGSVDFNNYSP